MVEWYTLSSYAQKNDESMAVIGWTADCLHVWHDLDEDDDDEL